MRSIYLDHNATTPMAPAAADAMNAALRECGNASSVHWAGRRARARIDGARDAVAALVGAAPADVVFTSGGTEANNLALCGLAGRRLIVSAVEHGSVLAARADAEICPVDEEGRIELDALRDLLGASPAPALLSLMAANNETGVIQPVAEAAEICREFGTLVHCDAVQAAGKMALDWRDLGADLVSLSAHKIGGPQGVGALIVDAGSDLKPMILGGGQERGLRAGTENLPGIAGFGAAVGTLAEIAPLAHIRDSIEDRIGAAARIYGAGAPRIGNTSCIGMQGVLAETQVMAFDLDGIMVSAGAACSSGKVTASHVLEAMGIEIDEAMTALRVTMGKDTTTAEIDRFLTVWTEIYRRNSSHADVA